MEEKFIVIQWPESQELNKYVGWVDNCHLISDDSGVQQYGSQAYFVNEKWYEERYIDYGEENGWK